MTRPGVHVDKKALFWPLVVALCLVAGCDPMRTYRPGFLLEEPLVQPGKPPGASAARRVGCLDVRVALACNGAVSPDFPLVAFTLGNRCDAAIPVDFTRIRATGRMAEGKEGEDGSEVMLSPFDPAREIHPAVLGSRAVAREVLEYDASPREATRRIAQVCLDLGGLSEGGELGAPLCLTLPGNACGRS
jgi:hypothetical protein